MNSQGFNMNSNNKIQFAGIFCAVLAIGVMGCGGEGDVERPDTYPISGTVTFNGAPIEGASVSFVPQGDGRGAAGFTDGAGKYTLTTLAAGDGAVPGQYQVKIVKFGKSAEAPTEASDTSGELGIAEDAGYNPDAEDAGEAAQKNLLPEKYADSNTSGLTVEVIAGENPPHDFKL